MSKTYYITFKETGYYAAYNLGEGSTWSRTCGKTIHVHPINWVKAVRKSQRETSLKAAKSNDISKLIHTELLWWKELTEEELKEIR